MPSRQQHATMNHICRSAPTVIKTSPHQKGPFRCQTSAGGVKSLYSIFRNLRISSVIPERTRRPKARHHVPATISTIERISKTCMQIIVCHRGQGLANQGSFDPTEPGKGGDENSKLYFSRIPHRFISSQHRCECIGNLR